jgi:hypothetical protein
MLTGKESRTGSCMIDRATREEQDGPERVLALCLGINYD